MYSHVCFSNIKILSKNNVVHPKETLNTDQTPPRKATPPAVKRSISEQNSHAPGTNDGENFSKLEDRHPRPPPPPNPPPRGQRRPPPPLPPTPTSPTSPIRPVQPNPPGPAKPNVPVQSQGTGTLQHLFRLSLS